MNLWALHCGECHPTGEFGAEPGAQSSSMDGDLGHLQGNNFIIIKIYLPEIRMSKPGGRGSHNAAFARD